MLVTLQGRVCAHVGVDNLNVVNHVKQILLVGGLADPSLESMMVIYAAGAADGKVERPWYYSDGI